MWWWRWSRGTSSPTGGLATPPASGPSILGKWAGPGGHALLLPRGGRTRETRLTTPEKVARTLSNYDVKINGMLTGYSIGESLEFAFFPILF